MNQELQDDQVKDKFHLTFILFYCLGSLIQFPGSVIPNAQLYFKYKLRDTDKPWDASSNSTNSLQDEFTSDFGLVEKPTMLVALVVAAIVTRNWNPIKRLVASGFGFVLMFVFIEIFAYINTDSWQNLFLYLTLFSVFVISCCNGVFLIAVIQICFKLPPMYIIAILSGQSVCGIFSALLEILALLMDVSPETNGFIYFLVAILFLLFTLAYFIATLAYSRFFRYYYFKEAINKTDEENKKKIDKQAIIEVLKKQKHLFLSLILVNASTVSIHPGVTSTVQSVDAGQGSKWSDTFFVPVITFLCYNVFDLAGRELGIYIKRPQNNIITLCLSTSRLVLIPILLMCNLTSKHHTAVLFHSDTVYILALLTFAISNGYMTNNTIVNVSRNYTNEAEEKPITSALLAGLIMLSLGVFAAVDLLLVKII